MRTIFYRPLLIPAFLLIGASGCNSSPKPEQIQADSTSVSVQNLRDSNAVRSKSEGVTFRVLAKVVEVNEADSTITINHEKMEGFMEAMEMPYKVGDPSIFKKVRVGTEGHFTVKVIDGEGVITNVHVHGR